MAKKTNLELVEYCKGCVGLPYIYATFGEKLTLPKLDRSYENYPKYWTKERYEKAKKEYIGKKVQDCTGLLEGFLMGSTPTTFAVYNAAYDKSANGWFSSAKEKGKISELPELPGVVVRYDGHMGIYIGNGEVIEARGFDYGVIKTKLKDRGWTDWFKINEIEYTSVSPNTGTSDGNTPAVKTGDAVTIAKGAKYGGAASGKKIPGKFTGGSKFTVSKVQKNNGVQEALLKELVSWVPTQYLAVYRQPKVNYFPQYTGKSTSIVDALKAIGTKTGFAYRVKIARANGIKLYLGSATQNNQLVKLVKKGKLIQP